MNKKDFKKYIEENLTGLSLSRQIEELQKIQNVYIPELINARKKKEGTWISEKDKDKYIFCEKCKKYYLKKKWKYITVNEVKTIYTYRDAGYGDDDVLQDVEYSIIYGICPNCSNRQERYKRRIRVIS